MRPRPVVGKATVPDAVRRLLDKFEYPDRGLPEQVVPIIPSLGGSGNTPTVVVAASDSRDATKAAADFVCDGTDDHVEIQAAVDRLDDEGVRGRLFFGEGDFDVDFITLKRGITLDGARSKLVKKAGTSGGLIRTDGTNFGIGVVGLLFDGQNIAGCSGMVLGDANWTRVDRCIFSDWRSYGIDHDDTGTGGNPLQVSNSSFTNEGATSGLAGIRLTGGSQHTVLATNFRVLATGIRTVTVSGLTVLGCLTAGSVAFLVTATAGSTGIQVIGNITGAAVSTGAGVTAVHNNAEESHAGDAHTVASHSDTTGTGAELETLTDGSDADALHDHPVFLLLDGTRPMTGALSIAQSAAVPVITLDQADVDEDFFKFIGTSDTNVDRALVDAVDFSTPGAIAGWLKINIQDDQGSDPITDGDYYIPFYGAPSA